MRKQTEEMKNRKLAEDKRKEEKRNNGMKKEAEIEVVPSSSASEEANEEEEEEEEEAKSSNNSNQNSNKAKEEDEEEEDNEDFKEKKNVSGFRGGVGSYCFPMDRIRRIIRSEGDDFRTTQEAVFLINKASERFLEVFCEDAYAYCVQDRKKAVAYKHLSSVVCKEKRYDFLSDFVPEKLRAEDALADRRLAGP